MPGPEGDLRGNRDQKPHSGPAANSWRSSNAWWGDHPGWGIVVRWLIATAVVVGGVIVAGVIAKLARRLVDNPKRPPAQRALADPVGSVAFALVLAGFLVAALGVGDKESLKTLPHSLVAFLPKLLVALVIILVGSAMATLAANAVGAAIINATGSPQPAMTRVVRSLLVAVFAILAVSQLGVNTRVVDTLVAGMVFGTAASMALLVGLGGRSIAADLAAGRYLRRIVRPGDRIEVESGGPELRGVVRKIHGATVELGVESAESADVVRHVPSHALLREVLRIERPNSQ